MTKRKNFKKSFLFASIIVLFLVENKMFSQDVITLNDGSTLKVKVIEVGETQVKYKPYKGGDRVVVMDRTIVKKIRYEGEQFSELSKEDIEKNYFFEDHREIVKIGFTSVMLDGFSIAYEKALNPTQSWEIVGRYQGTGFLLNQIVISGYGTSFGFRQSFNSSKGKARKGSHILSGWYIKPEATIFHNSYNLSRINSNISNAISASLGINFGGQWVFNNSLVFEVFTGVGFGGIISKTVDPNKVCFDCQNNLPEESVIGGELGISGRGNLTSLGIRLGYVFDSKKRKK
jgi:hypothetical protein